MTDLIRAPFTPAQVEALNRYQTHGNMHPFTCGNDRGRSNVVLIARTDGWHCSEPLCDYRQDWAHAFMADPEAWPKPAFGATARADVRLVNTRTGQGVATGGNDPDVIGWSWPRTAPAEADERDQPSAGGTLRDRYGDALRRAFDVQIIAEWICCDPVKPGHKLCRKGETTREMVASLLSDSEEAAYPSRVLDALMAVPDEERDRLREQLRLVAADRDGWGGHAHRSRVRADSAEARLADAEAALARVRAVADRWGLDGPPPFNRPLTELRAALDNLETDR